MKKIDPKVRQEPTRPSAAELRAKADELLRGPCRRARDQGVDPCLKQERERLLTKAERRRGMQVRPFGAYEVKNLCGNCAVYWVAEIAAQEAERRERDEQVDRAERAAR